MPFKSEDVSKHKKGLDSSQKKKWVEIANAILADCIKAGGTDKTCAPKAIRIANSKFGDEVTEEDKLGGENLNPSHFVFDGKNKNQTIPVAATSFTDSEAFAKIDSEGNVDILAYSGKPFQHWYWDNFAIDVSGGEFPQKFYPILEQHDVTRKVGFSTKPLTDNNQLTIKNMSFLENDESEEFQKNSKAGFPYQASIQGRPKILEHVEEGESADVNGYKLKGPGTIWRKWTYMETSVCVFGADANTRSKALSLTEGGDEIEVEVIGREKSWAEDFGIDPLKLSPEGDGAVTETKELQNLKEVKNVDLKELKEKDPEAFSALMQEATEAAKLVIKKEVETPLAAKLAELSTIVTKQSEQLSAQQEVLLSQDKRETIRKEDERKLKAESIWSNKLATSEIPEHLFQKVQAHVSYTKFVKDDSFDEVAFSAAVEAEILDWTKSGISKTVIGTGFTLKDVENKTTELAEDKSWIQKMAKLAGQTITIN